MCVCAACDNYWPCVRLRLCTRRQAPCGHRRGSKNSAILEELISWMMSGANVCSGSKVTTSAFPSKCDRVGVEVVQAWVAMDLCHLSGQVHLQGKMANTLKFLLLLTVGSQQAVYAIPTFQTCWLCEMIPGYRALWDAHECYCYLTTTVQFMWLTSYLLEVHHVLGMGRRATTKYKPAIVNKLVFLRG